MNAYRVTAKVQGGQILTGVARAKSHQEAIAKMRGAMQTCDVIRVRSSVEKQASGWSLS